MIPIRLSIKNFMCYRDNLPMLSFEGIHIACLCGDNGNGKSAIFDAMTWALWGESRAKSDDDLIHLGQSEMEVDLEYFSRGQVYRVIRKRSRRLSPTRPGHTVLEFQVSDDNSFKSLSGNSLPETQKKIIDLLSMDYQTFVNSAFLRQGHADEFSIKRPGERKEIIANILNLSQYDELERKAKEQAQQKKIDTAGLENSINDMASQIANKVDYETKSDEIQELLSRIEEEKKQKESLLTTLRTQKEMLARKQDQLKSIQDRIKENTDNMEYWKKKNESHSRKIAEYEQILAKEDEINRGYTEFVEINRTNEDYNRKLGQLLTINEHINSMEQVIRQASDALTIEYEKIRAKIADRMQKYNKIEPLEQALVEARRDLIPLTEMEQELATQRKEAHETYSRISYLESTLTQLENELAGIDERQKLISRGATHCPLCETELGEDGIQRIELKLKKESEGKNDTQQSTQSELDAKREKWNALDKEIREKEEFLNRERGKRQSRIDLADKELQEAREAGNEIEQETIRLKEIEELLVNKQYAVDEQQALLKLENERKNLDYNKEKYEHVKKQLDELIKYEKLKREYDEVVKYIDQEKNSVSETKLKISGITSAMQELQENGETITAEIEILSKEADKLDQVEKEYNVLLQNERRERDNLAAFHERIRHLDELDTLKREKEELLIQAQKEESIYRELAEAFSKKGVQALLISQAYPEIEMEANRLLGKMTDNRLSIALESQREMKSKKDDVIQTLDIKIADELGTRNYEMYSGGEAFRIDLALRIALSKLLVRRAGASLPLLIIDEGFGTQDSSGRERLVEAINSIQDDFEKIFIITHLEELKDSFPVTINVYKTSSGSTISIN
jgi:DNA repair protein SbcC/Rad50